MNRRIVKPTVPLFGAPGRPAREPEPRDEPPALPAPEQAPPGESGASRANLTVRLSEAERERLTAIARAVGRPDPLSLAGAVRWLINHWKP